MQEQSEELRLRGPRRLREHLVRLLSDELEHQEASTDAADEQETLPLADVLLRDALREGASDIHLEPHSECVRVRFRIDGILLDAKDLPPIQGHRLIRHFKTVAGLDPATLHKPEDARRTYMLNDRELDLRLACAPCMCGEKMAIRVLDRRRVEQHIDELGLCTRDLDQIREWLSHVTGMFLVTGPTGSGKTTTLYALLHELKMLEGSVVTIEDPVEYQIDGITQMQVSPERGLTFFEGLKAMLRLDPDYLLLGEIRGPDSARAAIEASKAGRVLMSTMHSRDSIGAVTSLRQWGLRNHEIAAALEVVIAQRLVRRLCVSCRRSYATTPAERRWLEACGREVPDTCWHAVGCEACRYSGYRGRTGIFELWRIDETWRDLIAAGTDEQGLRRRLSRANRYLLDAGLEKVSAGITCIEELARVCGSSPLSNAPAGEQAGTMQVS